MNEITPIKEAIIDLVSNKVDRLISDKTSNKNGDKKNMNLKINSVSFFN